MQRSLCSDLRDAIDLAGYETWNWQTLPRGERTEIRFAWACRCGADRIEAIEFHRDFVDFEECVGLLLTDMEDHEDADQEIPRP